MKGFIFPFLYAVSVYAAVSSFPEELPEPAHTITTHKHGDTLQAIKHYTTQQIKYISRYVPDNLSSFLEKLQRENPEIEAYIKTYTPEIISVVDIIAAHFDNKYKRTGANLKGASLVSRNKKNAKPANAAQLAEIELYNESDVFYYGNVSIGTPPQILPVVFGMNNLFPVRGGFILTPI